jgi:UDP-N-acetylglucosamine:LPS N-acetylglucosamine transferase
MKPSIANEALHKKMSFVLSGPEPQRTLLEEKIIVQVREQEALSSYKFLLVRGKAHGEKIKNSIPSNLEIIDFADSEEMASIYTNCDCLVVRSGYSTVMDLAVLDCRHAIYIPTPGQIEQEYLAEHLHQERGAAFISQKDFQLRDFL